MGTTYELWDEGWTSGGSEKCYGWTEDEIKSMAKAFGVKAEIDPFSGNVYEISEDDEGEEVKKLIGRKE